MRTIATSRAAGWIAAASLVGSALLGPAAAAVSANDLHQTPPISWDASGYGDEDCPVLEPGQVLWHFIQNQVGDEDASGTLTATFTDAGKVEVESYKKSGPVLHWQIITGHDTLLDASTDVDSDGNFNLSHICVGPEGNQTPSAPPSETPSESVGPSEAPSESVAPSEAPSESVAPSEAPSESVAPSEAPSESTTPSEAPSESVVPSESASPTGSVEAATGTPRLTPPPTDTASTTVSRTTNDFGLALLAIAGLLLGIIVRTPARKRIRRD